MKHCLVVDDSSVIRKVARRILEDLSFEISEAEDGGAALDACRKHMPDAVLLDWNMPVMDGLGFVQAVRKRPEWRGISLMMVTTESEQDQIVRALAAGAHEYLIKPFAPEAFIEKLDFLGLTPARSSS